MNAMILRTGGAIAPSGYAIVLLQFIDDLKFRRIIRRLNIDKTISYVWKLLIPTDIIIFVSHVHWILR